MVLTSCSNRVGKNVSHERLRRRRNSESFRDSLTSSAPVAFALVVLVVLLVSASAETTTENDFSSSSIRRKLIINGDQVAPSDHKFFVRSWPDSVRETSDVLCGASLIHSDIILTAAHCQGAFNYGAMAYDPKSGQINRYKKIDLQIAYPDYYQNMDIINYDIMVMRLTSPITDILPVQLNANPNFPMTKKNEDSPSMVLKGLGVGLTETGEVAQGLDAGLFNAISNDQCAQRLGNVNVALTDDIMCGDPATDDSICLGDSGGPLTASVEVAAGDGTPWSDPTGSSTTTVPVQVGIVSFGNDCEVDWIPDGFTRISYFHDWIYKQICKYSRDPPSNCFDYLQSEEYFRFITAENPSSPIPYNEARITLEFQHDFLAEQTIFAFRNTKTNEMAFVGPHYVPQRGELVVSTFMLPVPGNYALEIHDSGQNGLNNPNYVNPTYRKGNWTLSAEYSNGGRLEGLATGDSKFESLKTTKIKLPKMAPAPTTTPSESSPPPPSSSIPLLDLTTPDETVGGTSTTVTRGVDTTYVEPFAGISSSSPPSIYGTWRGVFVLLGLAACLMK